LGAPFGQEISAAAPIDLGKYCFHRLAIRLDRLQQHRASDAPHMHLFARHAKLLRKAHRLAAPVFEKLGRRFVGHLPHTQTIDIE